MAKQNDNIKKKLKDFMTSEASEKPHIGILVEGFQRDPKQITFMHNGKKIIIPIEKVLFPTKKPTKKEYVDFNNKIIWVFLKGTVLINTTDTKSVYCEPPTCKANVSVPATITGFEAIVPTYYDFSLDF
jgi:hypothetical protein